MKPPEGMTILTVEPRNYDEIIERSQGNPHKEPYTKESLERLRADAKNINSVALVMFLDPEWYVLERDHGKE